VLLSLNFGLCVLFKGLVVDAANPLFFVLSLVVSMIYTPAFRAKSARTNLTDHAVVRSVSFTGEGIFRLLTPRQILAALTPYKPFITGKRIYALSGNRSKFARASGIGCGVALVSSDFIC
jgi:hypothetical protein